MILDTYSTMTQVSNKMTPDVFLEYMEASKKEQMWFLKSTMKDMYKIYFKNIVQNFIEEEHIQKSTFRDLTKINSGTADYLLYNKTGRKEMPLEAYLNISLVLGFNLDDLLYNPEKIVFNTRHIIMCFNYTENKEGIKTSRGASEYYRDNIRNKLLLSNNLTIVLSQFYITKPSVWCIGKYTSLMDIIKKGSN